MSRLDQLLKAERDGVLLLGQETEDTQTLQPTQEPLSDAPSDIGPITDELGNTVEPYVPTLPLTKTSAVAPGQFVDAFAPEIEEYKQAMMSDESEQPEYWKGMGLGIGTEITMGVAGTYALQKARPLLSTLKGLKNVSKVGMLAPEGLSTVAGIAGWVAAEGAIWGVSNYVGQLIRESYGLQDDYSAGEGIAATVFGLTPIWNATSKLFKLPPSFAGEVGWKSREMYLQGGKVFAQGATIGLAETTLRNEVQVLLNERSREDISVYEYLLGGVVGGGANVGIQSMGHLWSRTGKWGRNQAETVTARAKAKLEAEKTEYQAWLNKKERGDKTSEGYVDPAGQGGTSGGYQTQFKGNWTDTSTAMKRIEQIDQATAMMDDALDQVIKVSKAADKRKKDLMPSKITDETLEAPLPKAPQADAPTAPKAPEGFEQTKVVDKEGKPAVMYHGSVEDFDAFDVSKMAQTDPDAPFNGFWFTSDKGAASPAFKNPKVIKEFFLDIKNPAPPEVYRELSKKHQGNELREELQKLGYDGVKWGGDELIPTKDPNKFIVKSPRMLPNEVGSKILKKEPYSITRPDGTKVEGEEWNLYDVIPKAGRNKGEDGLSHITGYTSPEEFMKVSGSEKTWVAFSPEQIKSASSKNLIDETIFGKGADAPTPPKTPTKEPTQQPEGDEIDALVKRFAKVNKDNMSLELPDIAEAGRIIRDKHTEGLEDSIRTLAKKGNENDVSTLESLISNVRNLNRVETQVLDTVKTTFGRTGLGLRKDSDRFKWLDEYSLRARESQDTLNQLEKALQKRLEGAEADDLSRLVNDYTSINKRPTVATPPPKKKAVRKRGQPAKKELTQEAQAQKIATSHNKQVKRLGKELDEYRARFGDMDAVEARVAEAGAKPKPDKPQDVKDLEDALRFHKEAEKEALAIVALEKEFAKTVNTEARGIMGDMRAATKAKPTGPKVPKKSDELRKKITESKARMRTRLKQIDKAREDIVTERELADVYKFYERNFYDSMNKDRTSMVVGGARYVQQARQLALINQLPSVMAGVGTNIVGAIKQFSKGGLASVPVIGRIKGTEIASPVFLADKLMNKLPMSVARANARAEAYGAWMMLKDMDGIFKAMKRTFLENVGATTGQSGKFSDEVSQSALPRGTHALVARAHKNAERRAQAIENVGNTYSNWITKRNFLNLLSLGVRGIQTLDEGFKRQMIKGRIWSEATKGAISKQLDPVTGRVLKNFDNVKAERDTLEGYNAAWKDSDGLAVLKAQHEYQDEVNNVSEELLFASNGQRLQDVAEPLSDKFATGLNKLLDNNSNEATSLVGALLKTWLPYVGVPTRAVGRGIHYGAGIVTLPLGRIKGLQFGKYGTYNKQIKKYELEIKNHEEALRTKQNLTKTQKAEITREIQELQERLDVSVVRRAKQNREDLTDMLMGYGLLAYGMYLAKEGGQGSLDHLSKEQRKDSKLTPFTLPFPDALGGGPVDYKTAMPWSLPIALGANVQQWNALKEEQTLTGVKLLKKDFFSMLGSTFITLNLEQPFVQGLKQAKETIQGLAADEDSYEKEKGKTAIANTISSFVSIIFPTQAKKIIERITTKGIPDFRGGSFQDRLVYGMFGIGPANIKTDRLGEPKADNRTWLTQNVWRLFPKDSKEASEFEKVETGTSLFGVLSDKPTQLKSTGVSMVEWVDEDNFSLSSTFDAQLRKQKLSQKVERLVSSAGFQKALGGWKPEGDKSVNASMTKLNDLLLKEWGKAGDTLLKNGRLLKRFVNKDGDNLYEHLLERKKTSARPVQVELLQDIIENN